jgi:hypothetical protein
LKFFAFFDLEKLKKIFTALLLERSILVVSKDLENLTSCGLSFEYLIYPLEWLHTYVPIVPEHIDLNVFNQPFPFIYGVHTCIYEKLQAAQLESTFIILVDERQILNGDRDRLPANIDEFLTKKLDYFKSADVQGNANSFSTSAASFAGTASSTSIAMAANEPTSFHHHMSTATKASSVGLLSTATIKSFLDSVLMVIDDYREYLVYDQASSDYKLDENIFFKMKNVYVDSTGGQGQLTATGAAGSMSNKYQSCENEFYHELRITQAFEEVFVFYLAYFFMVTRNI